MRSTLRSARAIRAVLTAAASLTLVAGALIQPAGAAAKKTSLSITKASVGKTISVAGKLTAGTDSVGAVQVGKDDAGDDFPPAVPNGTDFTGAWIKADPAKRVVTFSFHLDDPNPLFTISPGWDILWQFTVDGTDTGQHFQIGNIGGFPVPSPGPYALYCTLSDDGFLCDHELTPVFGDDGTVSVSISFDLIGAEPGSVIGTSAAGAGVDTLTDATRAAETELGEHPPPAADRRADRDVPDPGGRVG